ncbi:MAG: phenylalanine 4-monooxygenase [Gemmatimonadales bacterium]|nr:MAG: phenylalanine 4-monooxygenase [Gemmatimonadales bacterium]
MSNDGTSSTGAANDLTTTKAPFIEEAVSRGELYIRQPYELYSADNHRSWGNLYRRMHDRWQKYANHKFLEGIDALRLNGDRVPHLEDINEFLRPLTGFIAKPVSGFVPAYLFFDCLGRREFPTTITIRDVATPDYLPEPDIFHDIAGHVPMHTDPAFAETLVRFGQVSRFAADRLMGLEDEAEVRRRLASNMRAMARFFWFTIEFGLMRDHTPGASADDVRVYGSGLLSSRGEIAFAVDSPDAQRFPFQLEWVVNQGFEIDHYQPLYFIVDSFDHLFQEVERLEAWMKEGRLDNVAPGNPVISDRELDISLAASREGLEAAEEAASSDMASGEGSPGGHHH